MPIFRVPPPTDAKRQKDLDAMKATLDKIENVFLKKNKFLTGDEATFADIMAVEEVS